MVRLVDIKIEINKVLDENMERQALTLAIRRKFKIDSSDKINYKILKKSIDARKKAEIFFVYTLEVMMQNENTIIDESASPWVNIPSGSKLMYSRPVIIGMGPAGLFAGLILAKHGYKPLLLERGDDVDTRTVKVEEFWKQGILDSESNVQFGEGGAGTFSDGKLTTLINDKRCHLILEEFVKAGAPPEILYKSKPHVGTDILKNVVKNIRNEIISYGGEVKFRTLVTDIIIKNGKINGVIINGYEEINSDVILLAIGHSARDTYEVLHRRGVAMNQKPFSLGVRIEHPQELINKAQYGEYYAHPALGAADYKLAYHSNNGRSAYTFCMCPGGYVVAAASEEKHLVTNGMSESKRDANNANAALLVGVKPEDYGSNHPLAGIEFQRKWEHLAYQIGGGKYLAPVQLTGDFLADKPSTEWGSVAPTYEPGVVFAELKDCLPSYVINTLKEAVVYFDRKIKGFARADSILTGVETRSSSPVRIIRNEEREANISGLFPIGEGAGYAGGIMSSAVDGVKTAEQIMMKFAPN